MDVIAPQLGQARCPSVRPGAPQKMSSPETTVALMPSLTVPLPPLSCQYVDSVSFLSIDTSVFEILNPQLPSVSIFKPFQ